jgi:hypothetical protein
VNPSHYYGRNSNAVYALDTGGAKFRYPGFTNRGDIVGDEALWSYDAQIVTMNWRTSQRVLF